MENKCFLVWEDDYLEDIMVIELNNIENIFLDMLRMSFITYAKVYASDKKESKSLFLKNILCMSDLNEGEIYEINKNEVTKTKIII